MLMNSNEYLHIVESIKQEIRTAQYRAAVSVNRELLLLYHSIGEVINAHKTWGSKFVENLAADIRISFPDATGYSVRNLKYMAKFALRFPDKEIVQAALAQITWYHHIALMDKVKNPEEHIWYAEQAAQNGWSRNDRFFDKLKGRGKAPPLFTPFVCRGGRLCPPVSHPPHAGGGSCSTRLTAGRRCPPPRPGHRPASGRGSAA